MTALADRWGYGKRNGPGKIVWAEYATERAADQAPEATDGAAQDGAGRHGG
ncbi:hypothetical protein [Streptomyces sp. NPDC090053]|uniref:hypothetical protein n=1 Tax=Streptomyces sp. NPDC090053 TaxID=3365932 RepID=UPI003809B946